MSTTPSARRRLERELAGLLAELSDLRDQLESSPAGLVGHCRRRRLARQLAGLERRMGELRARWAALPDGTSQPVPTRAEQAGLRLEDVVRPSPRKRARRNRLDAMLRAALAQLASGQPAGRRTGPRRRRPKN